MPELTPSERVLRAQMAAYTSWANTKDRKERTEPAREAAMNRFEKQVDPDGTMDPKTRAKAAASARSAHFKAMAYKSARARSRNRARQIEEDKK